jgi:hypothetical protein
LISNNQDYKLFILNFRKALENFAKKYFFIEKLFWETQIKLDENFPHLFVPEVVISLLLPYIFHHSEIPFQHED